MHKEVDVGAKVAFHPAEVSYEIDVPAVVDFDDMSGRKCTAYLSSPTELRLEKIQKILTSPNADFVSRLPPTRPAAGTVYVFPEDVDRVTRRCDQYQWMVDGTKDLPRAHPVVKKHYFYARNQQRQKTKEFRKYEYQLIAKDDTKKDKGYVLVHYLGDHLAVGDNLSHGNATKRDHIPYIRSFSTVKSSIVAEGTDRSSIEIYRKLTTSGHGGGAYEAVSKPRNKEQVRNFVKATRRQLRIGHDGLFNCVELACQFPDYVRYIQVHPSLVIYVGNTNLLKELDQVIQLLDSPHSRSMAEIQYDTTFTLGDFYVSTLSFRHAVFDNNPVIPVAFMIHERKYRHDHHQFMEYLRRSSPMLQKKRFCFVSDNEFAFDDVFPSVVMVHCWNHIRRDARLWLRKNGASTDDLRVYSDHLLELMTCENEGYFVQRYQTLSGDWTAAFKDYFDKSIKPNIEKYAGRWIIEPTGLYNAFSGVYHECVWKPQPGPSRSR